MKKSSSKSNSLSVGAFGERIRRALWLRQSRTGGKVTLTGVGEVVAGLIGRGRPFTAGTVSGWLEGRSEPELTVFLALSQWTGVSVAYLAFGDAGKDDAERYTPATETPEGYYADVTETPARKAAAKKRRGA